ncbi:MAG: putative O-glycosylation ligase, exosortase A system-associated [Burkholderiales bacterium]|nr:putative O-glycosylation ligase, exosortase A system-associated [Burkholderiales bacterium]
MRDVLFTLLMAGALPAVLRWPWVGVMLWTWLSVMSPHRLTWGFAWNQPWAQMVAVATLLGMLFSSDRKHIPVTRVTVALLLMPLWMAVTSVFALEDPWFMLTKVGKIYFMLFVTLALLHTRKHIEILVWIIAGSIAFYGVKGGLFTIRISGGERVWGPSGSYIEDNNALAAAVIMCIPLLYYIRMTVNNAWVKRGMLVCMALCGFSVIGSHSRGALLAGVAMCALLWWRGKNKFLGLIAGVCIGVALVVFAPEKWETRMSTITTHEDGSAQGRINAWAMAVNLVQDRPIVGGGFDVFAPTAFARWAPSPAVQGAHSVYFQMLGEHGFPGLFLYLTLGMMSWSLASWIRKNAKGRADFEWAYWLASMCQVSLVGFAVGGAFLNLAYWDVPYTLIVALVLTRVLMEKEIVKEPEPSAVRGPSRPLGSQPGRRNARPALRQ